MIDQPLRTSSKGTFEFTLVADGLYIAHKVGEPFIPRIRCRRFLCNRLPPLCVLQWGKNSGHIGLPLESIPKFISYLQGFEERATGTKPKVHFEAGGVMEQGVWDERLSLMLRTREQASERTRNMHSSLCSLCGSRHLSFPLAQVAAGKAPGGTATKGQGISKKPAKQQVRAR